jgi:hypothetical protein
MMRVVVQRPAVFSQSTAIVLAVLPGPYRARLQHSGWLREPIHTKIGGMATHEVIYETVRIGGLVKVTAIDGPTGLEAAVIGRAGSDPTALRVMALRKLSYRLARNVS